MPYQTEVDVPKDASINTSSSENKSTREQGRMCSSSVLNNILVHACRCLVQFDVSFSEACVNTTTCTKDNIRSYILQLESNHEHIFL